MSNKYDRPTHEKIEIPEEKATPAQNLAFDYLVMIVNIGISVYNFVYAKSVVWGAATGLIALWCLVDVIVKTRRKIKADREKYAQQKLSEYIELEKMTKERDELKSELERLRSEKGNE